VTGERAVRIDVGGVSLAGDLGLPAGPAAGVVLFAHGSGSSRHSPRNRAVAAALARAGFATLLVDLLTAAEEDVDRRTRELRFDLPLLARRLACCLDWLASDPGTAGLPVGLFGASTGGGAALLAAAERPADVRAVVSRGGRVDLAGPALPRVGAPTLLLVGERDEVVLELNRRAATALRAPHQLAVVPGAGHLFEEPGALAAVTEQAVGWFRRYLAVAGPPAGREA
jgi:putative phosphoribosyl transferase